MRIAHELIEAILKRHDGSGQAPGRKPMSTEQLLHWIANRCNDDALREVKILMRDKMRYQNWSIAAGPHVYGTDENRRITIYINGIGHHLYLDAQDVIYRVTYLDANKKARTPSGIEPWDVETRG
jgi:hypothetical protein